MQRYNISDYQYRKFCLFRRLKILFYIKENSFYHLSTSFYHLYRYSLFFFRQYLPYILLIKDGARVFRTPCALLLGLQPVLETTYKGSVEQEGWLIGPNTPNPISISVISVISVFSVPLYVRYVVTNCK